ncbi:DUF6884 domain-containing protein [Streptomyces sp. NPDC020707]|uniref:DUF6884 domain-containing protein n=1 Tax=Streptomyces sp. NPDC020707 TaxID=3365084 RepID=UPI0037B3937E
MTNKTEVHLPAALRKWAVRTLEAETQDEFDLVNACKALGLGNSMNSTTVPLPNGALGVLIRQARKWVTSDNGNESMAGKSVLARHELDYEPDDPREKPYEVKMPKSLTSHFDSPFSLDFKKDTSIPQAVKEDLVRMSWAKAGASGRVSVETLDFFLRKMDRLRHHDHSAVKRAAAKFIETYTEPYEQAQRLINGYLAMGEGDQEPEEEQDVLTAQGFMDAIYGRGGHDEQQQRLVLVACGGKKSQRPGKIAADERYTGNYFTACLMASEVMDGVTMVLSAKYGLIPLTEEIENYDVTMGGKGSVRLGFVKQQVEELGLKNAKVTVLGGERYVKAARQIWPDAEAPLTGGIGQQLKQLAAIYSGDPLDDDEHQEQKTEGPYEWTSGDFRNIPNLPGRYAPHKLVIWFGGKAGKANPEPGKWMKVRVIYTGEGRYDLIDLGTDESVLTCTLVSKVHWAPGIGEREFDEWRQSRPAEPEPAADTVHGAPAPGLEPTTFEVPVNFLELAEDGDTPQARAYWTRRCEEYRRTGE